MLNESALASETGYREIAPKNRSAAKNRDRILFLFMKNLSDTFDMLTV